MNLILKVVISLCCFFYRSFVVMLMVWAVNFEISDAQDKNSHEHQNVPNQKEGMSLVWHDEFDKIGKPDSDNWNCEYGFVRNEELQWYQSNNAFCRNGILIIEGRNDIIENPSYDPNSSDWRQKRQKANYSSACLITRGLQEWPAGGYYEVRAKIDITKGAWPAIWLLGTEGEWPHNGEIDMMEFYRVDDIPHILANAAWATPKRYVAAWDGFKTPITYFMAKDPEWAEKFHVWSMKWDENSILLFLDGELLNDVDLSKTVNPDKRNPFVGNHKFYILLNLAIGANGGQPSESEFPITFEVDYVRVYR